MPSPFQGIETSRRALAAFQRSLDTTGHNIANVNTKGYSRQTTDLQVASPNTYIAGRIINVGSGVQVNAINRTRDNFLEGRRQDVFADQGRAEGNLAMLEKVQASFLDVSGKGISGSFDQFYNAWSALANDPTSMTARQQVVAAGRDIASKFRTAYRDLDAVRTQQTEVIQSTLQQVQTYADDIAKLNDSIRANIAGGGSPNDLMDQRDQMIAELSKLVDIDTNLGSDGAISIFMGSLPIVDQVGARTFPTNFDITTGTVSDGGSITWSVSSGALKGQMEAAFDVNGFINSLNAVADAFRTQVNQLHTSGQTNTGAAGGFFFADNALTPITGAQNLFMDTALDADPKLIVTGTSSAASDNSLALAMSKLRDQSVTSLGGQTTRESYKDLLTTVGRAITSSQNDRDTAYALGEQVEQQIQDVSGVNLDDELANLQKFQRAYQASAKVLSVMDETLGDLINTLRR